jgi:flagellar biosynthesis GTPase FlhF
VIRVGDARAQLTQRDAEEWQKEANKDVVNMAEQRAQRLVILEQEKKDKAAAKKLEKEQRATIKAAEREEQDMRKKAVKLAVKELGKAVTRAGLRSHDGPGKEAWRALEVYVKHKGEIYSREIKEGIDLDYNEIDLYVKCRLDYLQIVATWKEKNVLVVARMDRLWRIAEDNGPLQESFVFN